jgi:hypothetical protein
MRPELFRAFLRDLYGLNNCARKCNAAHAHQSLIRRRQGRCPTRLGRYLLVHARRDGNRSRFHVKRREREIGSRRSRRPARTGGDDIGRERTPASCVDPMATCRPEATPVSCTKEKYRTGVALAFPGAIPVTAIPMKTDALGRSVTSSDRRGSLRLRHCVEQL